MTKQNFQNRINIILIYFADLLRSNKNSNSKTIQNQFHLLTF